MMIKESGIDGIYIVHAKKGYEKHEERINTVFRDAGLDFELVTDGDPSDFDDAVLQKYFCPGILDKFAGGVVSCTLNHIFSYQRIIKKKDRMALVFENDPFFLGDFTTQIKKVAAEAALLPPGFIISLENTTLEFPPFKKTRKGKLLYEAERGRCAGAYLIDQKAALDILKSLESNKCCQVVDWWHNTMVRAKVVKMYWAHPPLVEQGSHNGLMSSTISTKNKSLGRRMRWLAQKFYKMYIIRWFK